MLLEILGFGLLVTAAALLSVPLAFATAGALLIVAAAVLDQPRRKGSS
jgi:hypothetical protein